MVRIVRMIVYGNVGLTLAETDRSALQLTFRRRSRGEPDWSAGVFDRQDLPALLRAIQRAYDELWPSGPDGLEVGPRSRATTGQNDESEAAPSIPPPTTDRLRSWLRRIP